jgi:lysozyme
MKNKALTGAALALALGGLTQLEGDKRVAYLDIAGVPTICAGTTEGVRMGDTATQADCYRMTLKDYRRFEKVVLDNITIPLNVNEQVALTYFCYNVGAGRKATAKLRKVDGCVTSRAFNLINQGRVQDGCEAMRLWNKVTINGRKVVSKGLDNRRSLEVKLCATPSLLYSYSPLLPE